MTIDVLISLVEDHKLFFFNLKVDVLMVDHTVTKICIRPKVIEVSLVFFHEDLVGVDHVYLLSYSSGDSYKCKRSSNS